MDSTAPWVKRKGGNVKETPRYKIISMSSHGGMILFRGIPSAYIDRTGHFGLWFIKKFLMHAGFLALQNGFFEIDFVDNKSTLSFAVNQSLRVSTDLYHGITNLSVSDLLLECRPAAVGHTSMTSLYILSCADTKMELVRLVVTVVVVSAESKRPKLLPEWLKDKYASAIDNNLDLLTGGVKTNRDHQNVPQECFRMEVKTRYSDIDFNDHVNQTEYIQFCLDCATEATRSGYYRHFTSDILWYPVLESDIIYLGESRACETLTVYTWQDKTDVQVIHFSIYNKSSSKCAAVAAVKFDKESLKLETSSNL